MKKLLSIIFVLSLIAGLAASLSAVPAMGYANPNPPDGNTPSVGIALTAFIGGVPTVGPVKVGDVITYSITLYAPTSPPLPLGDVAFYFFGGQLSILLPNSTWVHVAGYGGSTPDVPEVTTAGWTVACTVPYTVKASDLNPSGKLFAEAAYGSTVDYSGQANGYFEESSNLQEANASAASAIAIGQGTLRIIKNTTGGNGQFTYTVSSIGGSVVPQQTINTVGGTGSVSVTVYAGNYTVTEGALPAGWVSNDPSLVQTVTVPIGGTGTVTYNNTAQGCLKIVKNTTGADGTFTFSVSGGLSTVPDQTITTVGGTGSVLICNLIAGNYTVTEGALPAGWVSNDPSLVQKVTVPIGGTGTAAYSNTAQGCLQIVKNTTGGDGTFTFTATGPSTVAPQTITTSSGTGSVTVCSLNAGTYTVTEGALPNGWVSNDASKIKTVTVPIGGTGTVTYNNTAQGCLKIVKNTTGGDGTFTFTVSGPSAVAPQTIHTSSGTGQALVCSLTPGTYTVTEGALPNGWVSNDPSPTQTVTVPLGGTGTAAYSNTAQGCLKIVKNTTGGDGTFTFTVSGPSAVAPQTITTSSGTGQVTVCSLTAGYYTVTEGALPAGWVSNDASPTQTVGVPINGIGTVIYNNTAQGCLKIVKNTTGGDGTFTFTVSGPSAVAPKTITTSGGTGSVLVCSLIAGSYTVTEGTLPLGWKSNDASPTQTVTVPINGTGTAAYSNTGQGCLQIVKNTSNGDGTFTFTVSGPSAVAPQTITTSGGTGLVTVCSLTAGSYTVTEGALPQGWVSNDASPIKTVTVPIGAIATVIYSNTALQGNTTVTITASQVTTCQNICNGGGTVTLTIKEQNTGQVDLSNVWVDLYDGANHQTLDKNTSGFSGDVNPSDGKLNTVETWQWVLTKTLSASTTFVATGHGTDLRGQDITLANGYTTEQNQVRVEVSGGCPATNIPSGCTRTYDYWKTHAGHGPGAKDATWDKIIPSGADSPFFLSGQTYYQVLQTTAPLGTFYYPLARQYIAAKLNLLKGASSLAQVDEAITWAENNFFNKYHPNDLLLTPAKVKASTYASVLESYNKGLSGPGACSP